MPVLQKMTTLKSETSSSALTSEMPDKGSSTSPGKSRQQCKTGFRVSNTNIILWAFTAFFVLSYHWFVVHDHVPAYNVEYSEMGSGYWQKIQFHGASSSAALHHLKRFDCSGNAIRTRFLFYFPQMVFSCWLPWQFGIKNSKQKGRFSVVQERKRKKTTGPFPMPFSFHQSIP